MYLQLKQLHNKLHYETTKHATLMQELQEKFKQKDLVLQATQTELIKTKHMVKVVERDHDVQLNDQQIQFTNQLQSLKSQTVVRSSRALQREHEKEKLQLQEDIKEEQQQKINKLKWKVNKLTQDNAALAIQTLEKQLQTYHGANPGKTLTFKAANNCTVKYIPVSAIYTNTHSPSVQKRQRQQFNEFVADDRELKLPMITGGHNKKDFLKLHPRDPAWTVSTMLLMRARGTSLQDFQFMHNCGIATLTVKDFMEVSAEWKLPNNSGKMVIWDAVKSRNNVVHYGG